MPATDALRTRSPFMLFESLQILTEIEPPLTPAEREIVKSYGGWAQFMASFGLKPWEQDGADEGKKTLEAFVRNDSG